MVSNNRLNYVFESSDEGSDVKPSDIANIFNKTSDRVERERQLRDIGYRGNYFEARREFIVFSAGGRKSNGGSSNGSSSDQQTHGSQQSYRDTSNNKENEGQDSSEDQVRKTSSRRYRKHIKEKSIRRQRVIRRQENSGGKLYIVYADPRNPEYIDDEKKALSYVGSLIGHVDFSSIRVYRKMEIFPRIKIGD